MAEQIFRIERDSMGEVKVPKAAYYGRKPNAPLRIFPSAVSDLRPR